MISIRVGCLGRERRRIEKLKSATSSSKKATYSQIQIDGDRIKVIRDNTGKPCTFSLTALFDIIKMRLLLILRQ